MSEVEEEPKKIKVINERIKEAVIIRKEDVCKHEWNDLESLSANYRASNNGTIRPIYFEFCRLCRKIQIRGEIL